MARSMNDSVSKGVAIPNDTRTQFATNCVDPSFDATNNILFSARHPSYTM